MFDFTFVAFNYMTIDVGKYSTPQIYDLNNDGLNDLLVGEQNGFVNFYKNIGSISSAFFNAAPTNDTVCCITIQAPFTTDVFTVPFLYDSPGSKRLLVANENGFILSYDSIDGNIDGCYHFKGNAIDSSESTRFKFNITVSGGDLNGDGLTDIVIGQSTGGVEVRYQSNSGIGIGEMAMVKPSVVLSPNPANDKLNLRFYNLSPGSKSVLRLYNVTGELIKSTEISSIETQLDLSGFSNGIYMVQLISGQNSVSRKFIVSH
ncbi:MAG: T9SS type A sorting domain-containing protein [Bacteroidetes bacterium]|nr:T9SS type A sorting domain-containing protein [Bacteroidota bacterium]